MPGKIFLHCKIILFPLSFVCGGGLLVLENCVGQKDLSVSREIGSRSQYLTRCAGEDLAATLRVIFGHFDSLATSMLTVGHFDYQSLIATTAANF